MEYTNSETLLNPGNRGVDPSVGLTGYRLCDELNKQLRVCAAHRGWNTNIRQKENHLKKGQQMRFQENWHIFHNRELILWHLCYLHHCSARGRGRLKHYFALYGGTTTQDPFLLSYSYYFKTFVPPRPKSPKTFFLWDLPWDLARLFTSGLVLRPLEFLPRPPMQQNNTKYKYKQKFKHKQKQRSKINTGKYKYKFR